MRYSHNVEQLVDIVQLVLPLLPLVLRPRLSIVLILICVDFRESLCHADTRLREHLALLLRPSKSIDIPRICKVPRPPFPVGLDERGELGILGFLQPLERLDSRLLSGRSLVFWFRTALNVKDALSQSDTDNAERCWVKLARLGIFVLDLDAPHRDRLAVESAVL